MLLKGKEDRLKFKLSRYKAQRDDILNSINIMYASIISLDKKVKGIYSYDRIILTEWQMTKDGDGAYRALINTNNIAKRFGFVEKTGRVRIRAYSTEPDDCYNWMSVGKGDGPEDEEIRQKVDGFLIHLGYVLL